MLQAIRDGSKGITAKIIVGLIILTFALFGIESIVALGGGEDAPAEVNGVEISEYQVSQMVALQKRRMQAQFGDSFEMDDARLRTMAIETLINETLMKTAAQDAGVYYSDREIDKLILQSPEFQVNGAFDRDQFDLVLRSAGFTRSSYRELLRSNLTAQQIQNAYQASAFSTNIEANQIAKLEKQERDFSFATYSFDEQLKRTEITEEELKEYYDSNPQQFMTNESVVVDYVELNKDAFLEKIEVSEEDVSERYESMQAEANSKKEYRAAHILLLSNDEESRAKLKEAKAKLDSGLASFEDLAKEISEDDSSKFAGGDLGFASESVFEQEFADALVSLTVGEVSNIIETRDGLHLIKLLEDRKPEVAPLVDVKDSIVNEIKEEGAQALFVEALETLKDEAFSTSDLEASSKTLSLTIKTSKPITRFSSEGIAQYKSVVDAAFSDVVLNEGANSEVIEVEDGKAIVVNLNKFNESKVKEFSVVKSSIQSQLKNTKARKDLEERINEVLAGLKSDGELAVDWVKKESLTRNSQGVDSAILTKAFETAEGGYAVAQLAGGDKVIVRVDAIKDPALLAADESAKQKVSRGKAYNEYRAYQQFADDSADIQRN